MPAKVKALILAAGIGARLRPLTDTIPKCLVPISGRPLLDFWVDCLNKAGIGEARINTHTHAGAVRAEIERINAAGRLRLVEVYEPVLLGSAGTLSANVDLADDADEVVVIYADNLSDIDLLPLLAFHRGHGDPLTMVLFRPANPRACGIVKLDDENRIISFEEKPESPASELANAGLYVIGSSAYRSIAALDASDLAFEVLPRFVGKMRGWLWGGYHVDIGTVEALERANREVQEVFSTRLAPTKNAALRPAIFLDRDGTLIEHVSYLCDPARVRLLPGAAGALKRLGRVGFALVLVTNQSAIGRGMLTEERLEQIHVELGRQLAACGVAIDAMYHCPAVPTSDDRMVVENPDRKPGAGMLLRAAADLKLDLDASWMIGDLVSDVLAGLNAGCRSILLESGQTTADGLDALAGRSLFASDLAAAAEMILADPGAPR
jgi:D,D-heptose 1,7-bisphosphate phosphatase